MKTLGLIPARGGSKGVPRKNIRLLRGRPLLEYTTESALGAQKLSRVVLSTDDEEIAELGRRCGVEVPFMRPKELAQDDTPSLPVVQHALTTLEASGSYYDAVCLLQPTSPLRKSSDIDGCIDLLARTDADAVVSVVTVPEKYNPHSLYLSDDGGFLRLATGEARPISRRQDLPPAFRRDGGVYLARRDTVLLRNSLYGERLLGFLVEDDRWVDIDTWEDWERATKLLVQRERKE
jgi:CMP-N,N'-diacetyllegionaminic acid synthase